MRQAMTVEPHEPPAVAWHSLPDTEVAALLAVGPAGLTSADAERRLAETGPNVVPEAPAPPWWRTLLEQFRSPLIYILLVAAIVEVALGELVDAAVIGGVLLLNAGIGYSQERSAEQAVRSLRQLVTPVAHVLRDGREREIPSAELVPGDVVLVESGQRVPADLRLVHTDALTIDESLLTGESQSVAKDPRPCEPDTPLADRTSMAFGGCVVATGRGRGYVVATGLRTEIGAIADEIRTAEPPPSPLQVRMARLARVIGYAVGVAAVATFVFGLVAGEDPAEMFSFAVALAVSAVPEGLPVVLTITLTLGVRRMARRRAVIRHLPAVETLGSTTVIGTDKTGTLTQNVMTVQEVWAAGRSWRLDEAATVAAAADPTHPVARTVLAGVLSNEARLYLVGDEWERRGDPTEVALLALALAVGQLPEELRERHHRIADVPFESERQYSATLQEHDGERVVLVKGAPERVLQSCATWATPNGPQPLDRSLVEPQIGRMAAEGWRVLAMAERRRSIAEGDDHLIDGDFCFLGLVGMQDPPRPAVPDAVARCRRAGMRPIMITGDHAATAVAIARQVGIGDHSPRTLSGPEIDRLDDDALARAIREVDVCARVTPDQKLRVVQALRRDGEVVAVTGDGVNDAPSLLAADIGVAMGRSGTDVAREAADMVLVDDDFASIVAAVEEGRVTFSNVRKVTFYLLSSGVAEVLALSGGLLLGWPLILLPTQILWLNLMTDVVQDLGLAVEPAEPGLVERAPRPVSESVVSRVLWVRTVLVAVVMAAGTLAMFRWELDQTGSQEQARTMALVTMVLFQAVHVGNARSEHASAFSLSPFSNPLLLAASMGVIAVQAAVLYLPFTQFLLRVEPLEPEAWVRAGLVALTVIAAGEAHKGWCERRRRRERPGARRAA
jgi:Ca2+-transporting ATPase